MVLLVQTGRLVAVAWRSRGGGLSVLSVGGRARWRTAIRYRVSPSSTQLSGSKASGDGGELALDFAVHGGLEAEDKLLI